MKKYQGGGDTQATHYAASPSAQDNPMQYLLEQFGTLGYNMNPFSDIASQIGAITPESLMQNVRGTYDIGSKIDMQPGMFQGFSPTEIKSLSSSFYDPIVGEKQGTAIQALLKNMGTVGTSGFAGTGADIRKEDVAQDIYKRSMDKAWLGVEEQQAVQQKSILDKIRQAHQQGISLRYGGQGQYT